jgi:hypothetical protein
MEKEAIQEFIRQKNIENYRRRLAGNSDVAERALILKLLAEEEAKAAPTLRGISLGDEA